MSEYIKPYFEEIHHQLHRLERKYNPKGNNLHFADEAIPKADEKLFYNLLQLLGRAIEIVKDKQNRYSNKTAYAHAMFDFWYDYFLLISSASIRVKLSANSDDFPQEVIYRIIEELIYISDFSTIVSGDLYKRNFEALGNTLIAFHSNNLMNLINEKMATIKSIKLRGFFDGTIAAVERIRRRDMHWTTWKTEIDNAITEVCIQIIKEPLSYFSEADIQRMLVEELRKIKPISKSYPTSVHKGKGSKSTYSTSLLHCEYGGGGGTRIDIVIFDPDDVKYIDDVNLMSNNQYLKPVYAFELGTEKTSDALAHFKNDLKKLAGRTANKEGTGYLIHFYKDVTQARTGTKSRAKTEDKILKKFKQVFSFTKTEQMNKVKILGILLRTYRNQEKMRGKCEIFNGQEWVKKNIGNDAVLRSTIMKQLGMTKEEDN